MTDRERLIRLNLIPELGSTWLRRVLDAFGGLDRLWAADVRELQQVAGISPQAAERLDAARKDDACLERELALAERCGAAIVTLADAAYPTRLKTIPDPPLALYVRGTLTAADETAIAIVGSRRASPYGRQCAERLSEDLALRGITVVSGLALGIDGAAHRGALRAGGRTLAVLGSGLARLYPPAHERLADQAAEQGAVLSEYPLEAEPLPHHFPRRNRLISGLSLGVIVVEASARSGALITADCALEQGREVFAVPGPMTSVTSEGTHRLLKQGARLVTSVEDVLDELRLVSCVSR
ncbi:MAG: DNA-protecting protein DprA [Candidatus Omnitrophica bacterium]|nr:DNA-protecting protein DprA [Candidatus Omnitrophota bacterium]